MGSLGALLGRSWGSFWPLGGHFSEVFGRSCWKLGPGHGKKAFFGCFSVLLYAGLGLILLSSLAFRAAPPTAKRSLKKHEKPCVFSIRLLGCPCCGKCKENNFQSTGARKTKRKTSEKTTLPTFREILPKSSQNGSKIAPKSLPAGQRDTKRRQKPTKRGQKQPRAPQERPKSDFHQILLPTPLPPGPKPERFLTAPARSPPNPPSYSSHSETNATSIGLKARFPSTQISILETHVSIFFDH